MGGGLVCWQAQTEETAVKYSNGGGRGGRGGEQQKKKEKLRRLWGNVALANVALANVALANAVRFYGGSSWGLEGGVGENDDGTLLLSSSEAPVLQYQASALWRR